VHNLPELTPCKFSGLDFVSKNIRRKSGSIFEHIPTRRKREHDIRFLEIVSILILQQTSKVEVQGEI